MKDGSFAALSVPSPRRPRPIAAWLRALAVAGLALLLAEPGWASATAPGAVPPPLVAPEAPAPEAAPDVPPETGTEAAPEAEAAPDDDPLDLAELETRLRATGAIGFFTKLSLKNQVDDLIAQFRTHHRNGGPPTLAQLRQRFNLLLLKVLSLLQDDDPELFRDIDRSRDELWSLLADPDKFARL